MIFKTNVLTSMSCLFFV